MNHRHTIRNMAAATLVATMATACDLETSDNGHLDGYWHLNRVDTLATGGSKDMADDKVFWAVQAHLLNTVDHGGSAGSYLFRFDHSGDSLRLYDPYKDDRMNGDPKVETPDELRPFGVNATDETFGVQTLTGSRMVLSTDKLRLTFNKM